MFNFREEGLLLKEDMNAKDRIFEATLRLLLKDKSDNKLTVREIAIEARVNVALINYYYQSKDNLLQLVVRHKMSDLIHDLYNNPIKETLPKDQLKKLLIKTADMGFHNYEINKIAVEGELRNGCINSCNMVMPLLEMIFEDESQERNRIRALQLMVPLHNIMLYPAVYNTYLNTDFFDDGKRKIAIGNMVDTFLEGFWK